MYIVYISYTQYSFMLLCDWIIYIYSVWYKLNIIEISNSGHICNGKIKLYKFKNNM